jgi:hypothetical protein
MNELQEISQPLTEDTTEPTKKKAKRQLTGSLAAKVTAFILLVAMACVTAFSAIGAVLIAEEGLYTTSEDAFKRTAFEDIAYRDQVTVSGLVQHDCQAEAETYCKERNIAAVSVETKDGELL